MHARYGDVAYVCALLVQRVDGRNVLATVVVQMPSTTCFVQLGCTASFGLVFVLRAFRPYPKVWFGKGVPRDDLVVATCLRWKLSHQQLLFARVVSTRFAREPSAVTHCAVVPTSTFTGIYADTLWPTVVVVGIDGGRVTAQGATVVGWVGGMCASCASCILAA